jgi:hypothetical protein
MIRIFLQKTQPLQIDGWVALRSMIRAVLEFEAVMVVGCALRHFGVLMFAFFS